VNIKELKIDKSWSLFLDRDGVINKRLINNYVCKWENFEFLPGVLDGLAALSKIFNRIFIVTNQQGIGKGLMTEEDLKDIHKRMLKKIMDHRGRIDKIYYCPYKAEDKSKLRKPDTGMGLLAKEEYPEVIFEKSIMAGDGIEDMEFGKRLGMVNVLISDFRFQITDDRSQKSEVRFHYKDLLGFANDLKIY